MSNFEIATLDVKGKADPGPLFPGAHFKITDFEMSSCFRFCNLENGLCFEDIPEEVYTLELPKVPAEDDGSPGWAWARFFLARTEEEYEAVAKRDPEIGKAVRGLYELSSNKQVRAEYEMRQKAWRDRASQNDGFYQNGIKAGQREVAKRMKARGRPIDEIAEDTGLDMETIRGL